METEGFAMAPQPSVFKTFITVCFAGAQLLALQYSGCDFLKINQNI